MNPIATHEIDDPGIAILESVLTHQDEAIISVQGRPRFVVMGIAHYERLREAEIATAWQEAQAAIERGDFVAESAEEHIARLERELAGNAV